MIDSSQEINYGIYDLPYEKEEGWWLEGRFLWNILARKAHLHYLRWQPGGWMRFPSHHPFDPDSKDLRSRSPTTPLPSRPFLVLNLIKMSSDRSSALKDMLSAISRLSAEERLLMTDIVTRALYKAEGQSDSGRTVLDLPENPGPGPKPPNHKPAWVSTRKKEVRKWALRALEVENTSPCREWGVPAAADVTLVNESNEVDNIEFIFEHGSPPPQLPNSTLPAKHYVPFRIDWDNHSPMLTKWTLKASIAFAEWLIPKIHNNEFTCWLPRNDDPIAQHWE
ncbi:hypothetical protein FRC14_004150 [Serendipita sp. 396]|nr:hypothetical protein FRC14_004150 [Serendipita sp. 396]